VEVITPFAPEGKKGSAPFAAQIALRVHFVQQWAGLSKTRYVGASNDKVEKSKTSIRAKVEHSLRVTKRQIGFVKVRYRGLAKNAAQIKALFALSNLFNARKKLAVLDGQRRPRTIVAA